MNCNKLVSHVTVAKVCFEVGQTLNWNAVNELNSGSSLDDIRSMRLLLTKRNNNDDGSSSGTVVSKLCDKSL